MKSLWGKSWWTKRTSNMCLQRRKSGRTPVFQVSVFLQKSRLKGNKCWKINLGSQFVELHIFYMGGNFFGMSVTFRCTTFFHEWTRRFLRRTGCRYFLQGLWRNRPEEFSTSSCWRKVINYALQTFVGVPFSWFNAILLNGERIWLLKWELFLSINIFFSSILLGNPRCKVSRESLIEDKNNKLWILSHHIVNNIKRTFLNSFYFHAFVTNEQEWR